jgi:hypothetical protein
MDGGAIDLVVGVEAGVDLPLVARADLWVAASLHIRAVDELRLSWIFGAD